MTIKTFMSAYNASLTNNDGDKVTAGCTKADISPQQKLIIS